MVKRIAVLGSQCTGKSSLIYRYLKKTFFESYMSSMASEPFNDSKGNIIWDTPGNPRWEGETGNAIKLVKGVIVCFAPSNPESFNFVENFLRHNKLPCIVAATMSDLEPCIIIPKWSNIVSQYDIKIIKVSAAKDDGIFTLFDEIFTITKSDEISITSVEYATQQLTTCINTGLKPYIYDLGTDNT